MEHTAVPTAQQSAKMIPYAQIKLGRGFRATQSIFYYSQRLVCHPALRRRVARIIAIYIRRRRKQVARHSTKVPKHVLQLLTQSGWAMLDPLPASMVADMRNYLHDKPVYLPSGVGVPFSDLPLGTTQATYSLEALFDCDAIVRIVHAPQFLGIAEAWLGCWPTLCSIGARWSFPVPGAPAATQAFHRDPDDWRFLKVFVYLTDVDPAAGPHTYVAGSHVTPGRIFGNIYSDQEVVSRFGSQRIQTVIGSAGTCFVADTWGIHKGGIPLQKPRLLLQLQYSLLPNYSLDYSPLRGSNGLRFDPYLMRLLLRPGDAANNPPSG